MSTLSFKGLNKVYPNKVQAVFDFNLEIQDKEFIVFVGPSGCGKSNPHNDYGLSFYCASNIAGYDIISYHADDAYFRFPEIPVEGVLV